MPSIQKQCSVENCERYSVSTGLCRKHYRQVWQSKRSGYGTWCDMKSRCYNQNVPAYKYYGGRGITVCERWRNSYANFIQDMGSRPSPKHSIDRIDSDGNYEPGNCEWVESVLQANNKKNRTGPYSYSVVEDSTVFSFAYNRRVKLPRSEDSRY